MGRTDGETEIGGPVRGFQPTVWTEIFVARDGPTEDARDAWGRLAEAYWKPVYFHVRRKGHSVEDSKDLTQQFFASLLEREALRAVSPAKGRFRNFLLACLEHFLSDQYDRRDAAKRQPRFEAASAEASFDAAGSFERDWALAVLERGLARLESANHREAEVVRAQRAGTDSFAELAGRLGTTEANVKILAHRGRKRLRKMLLEELQVTADDPANVEDELKALFRALVV